MIKLLELSLFKYLKNQLTVQSQLFNDYEKQVTFILDLRYVDLGGSESLECLGGPGGLQGSGDKKSRRSEWLKKFERSRR